MSTIMMNGGLSDLPDPKYDYVISTEEALRHLEFIERHPIIELDTETTGLDPLINRVVLLQIGVGSKAFVFDVRDGRVDARIFKNLIEGDKNLKILQNAAFDFEMLYTNFKIRIKRLYDTMLAEQLLHLGLPVKVNLQTLVAKYLHVNMPKDIGKTFQDYNQEYQEYQLRYAASDVCVMRAIQDLQLMKLRQDGLMRAAKLEFDFVRPLCEMELNGMLLNTDMWKEILDEKVLERERVRIQLVDLFNRHASQTTLFGVSTVNFDSPVQMVKNLRELGIPVESTDVKELNKHKNNPVVKLLLEYRKYEKFVTTYGDPMMARIHQATGRLHSSFKQMVDTGRLSSSNPNLQNIPKEQFYRSCFVARPGYKLITADMSQAELRILADYSGDPVFLEAFEKGLDLHGRTASDLFHKSYEEIMYDNDLKDGDTNKRGYRGMVKALNFGLVYGLTKVGLSLRLGVSEDEAQSLINDYFGKYTKVKKWLDEAAKFAVINRYSTTISGRRRYYTLPDPSDPAFNRIRGSVERQGKNHPIQGCLIFDTVVKGIGEIGRCVGKSMQIETGVGSNKAFGVYSGNKEVYELKFSNGVKLGITLDHTILVCTSSGLVDKKVSDIDFNEDVCMVPLNMVDGSPTDLSGYVYKKGHWRETYVDYNYPAIMDEKLSFIIGCLIGDGNYSKHNYVNFVCRKSQVELFNKFNLYIKDLFGYDAVVNEIHKTSETLFHSQVSSVVIRGFLKHIGLEYVINRHKSVPKYFFAETVGNKAALLDGLFSTDGGVTKESGPNYVTTSKQLANDVHQLLFSVGINSNLKEYENEYGAVYRIQIPKRFISKFLSIVGASVDEKRDKLIYELEKFKGKDCSIVPDFIPKMVYNEIVNSTVYKSLSYNEKCHLRRFKIGSCSFSSWRKFFSLMPNGSTKEFIGKFLEFDFCRPVSLSKIGVAGTYDLMCEKSPRYFIANGVVVHNSNADTVKQAMIYVVERLEKYGDDARLLLSVHDELIIEVIEDLSEEIKPMVEQSVKDGFDTFFDKVKMKAEAVVANCWMK